MPAIAPQVVSWPADNVERWPVDRLVPNARNARTHSEAQVDQIAAAIREWGWTTPVLVSEAGTIIAGHGRVRAARKLALAEVPVMVAAGWSKAQQREFQQVRRFGDASGDELRAANRKKPLGIEPHDIKSRPVAVAMPDGDIDILACKIHVLRRCRDPEVDVRMLFGKSAEPVDQPFCGEVG